MWCCGPSCTVWTWNPRPRQQQTRRLLLEFHLRQRRRRRQKKQNKMCRDCNYSTRIYSLCLYLILFYFFLLPTNLMLSGCTCAFLLKLISTKSGLSASVRERERVMGRDWRPLGVLTQAPEYRGRGDGFKQ